MNLTSLKNTVIGYADRYDSEVNNSFAFWLPIVEGRINSVLSTRLSLKDIIIPIISQATTFNFPTDLLFLKQVKLVDTNEQSELIFQYVTETYLSSVIAAGMSKPYYTVTNNAFKVSWGFKNDTNEELHVRYEQKVPALVAGTTETNWLLDNNPEVYVFGLLVELYSFVKDAEAAQLWDARFTNALDNIENTDHRTQWSGTTPPQIKLG